MIQFFMEQIDAGTVHVELTTLNRTPVEDLLVVTGPLVEVVVELLITSRVAKRPLDLVVELGQRGLQRGDKGPPLRGKSTRVLVVDI